MSDSDRILNVINTQIDKRIKSGAKIDITYGQVYGLTAGGSSGYTASVYLAGSRELALSVGEPVTPSEGFRVPTHLFVAASDYVRVSMDDRGHRWIDEVFSLQVGGSTGGGGGVVDHGMLSGLADDDHPQYTTNAEATTIAAAAVTTHEAAADPHPQYMTSAEVTTAIANDGLTIWKPVSVSNPNIITTDGNPVFTVLFTSDGEAVMARVPA